jgi:hypothetical protein
MAVHFHLVQLERRHDSHDVDAAEEACEWYQPQSPPEQGVVKHHRIEFGTRHGIDHNMSHIAMYTCTLDVLYSYSTIICTFVPHESIRSLNCGRTMTLRETVIIESIGSYQKSVQMGLAYCKLQARRHSRMPAQPPLMFTCLSKMQPRADF